MKRRILFFALSVFAVALVALSAYMFLPYKQITTDFAMGSVLTQTIWEPLTDKNAATYNIVAEDIRLLEQRLLSKTEAPPQALEVMEATGGAFDPYLGAVVKLWNIDNDDGTPPRVPTQKEISQALQKREIDLGGYGKGAACDLAGFILRGKSAIINLGGNILTCGTKPFGQPFKIALRDPKGGSNDTIGIFTLKGTYFISTSGSYEKYFEQDGKRYHHILDPKTGYPAETDGLISVTVISGNRAGELGALGDMLSTACFVLGYEKSLPVLEQYDCDALFLYEDGTVRAAGYVKKYFIIEHPTYHWSEA